MIARYETDGMRRIWDRHAKYETWKAVELAITDAHAEMGRLSEDDAAFVRAHADFTLERSDEIEKETRHDLMAFVRNLSETVNEAAPGQNLGRYLHLGVTSYDVIDTALAMMLRDSGRLLIEHAEALRVPIIKLAREHAHTPQIGRTHGIHAEPITFGVKCANWLAELDRNIERLHRVTEGIAYGKVSGAVGVHAVGSPELEERVCARLGLKPDPSSTQIVNRDRHADFLNVLALTGAGLERIATELRNLQRTEILEVQEEFAKGQTGSSAMPHKRNPWNSETVCGLSRLLRANAHAMLESVATWHERDLTNSSLERIVFPDSCHLLDFMLERLTKILNGLVVMPENMAANLRKMGDLVFSEHVMIALIDAGLTREEAYKVAQRNAARAWEGHDFQTSVREDETVREHLTPAQIDEIFSLEHHLRYVDHTLRRTGVLEPATDWA